jgi:hypothetical protein
MSRLRRAGAPFVSSAAGGLTGPVESAAIASREGAAL